MLTKVVMQPERSQKITSAKAVHTATAQAASQVTSDLATTTAPDMEVTVPEIVSMTTAVQVTTGVALMAAMVADPRMVGVGVVSVVVSEGAVVVAGATTTGGTMAVVIGVVAVMVVVVEVATVRATTNLANTSPTTINSGLTSSPPMANKTSIQVREGTPARTTSHRTTNPSSRAMVSRVMANKTTAHKATHSKVTTKAMHSKAMGKPTNKVHLPRIAILHRAILVQLTELCEVQSVTAHFPTAFPTTV